MYFLKTSARAYRDYRPATLSIGKVWMIRFYVTDPATGKLRLIRVKLNHIPEKQRRSIANQTVAEINTQLALGWNPLVDKIETQSCITIGDALKKFVRIKEKESEDGTIRVYTSYIKIFSAWLKKKGIRQDADARSITVATAKAFMNSIDDNDKISPRTYNNYLKFLRSLFTWMMDKGYTSENPFSGIPVKPKKLTKKTRRLLSDEELELLFNYLAQNNKEYLFAALLCYCCFIRPKELALLRCHDIDLERQVVHIRPEIAKNDKDSYRTIPDDLMPLARQMDLSHPDWYLFADHKMYNFAPGQKQVCSRKLAKYWSDYLRKACDFPMELQFYSLKDTGITNMIERGVPLNLVQQQADHSSIAMTAIYVGRRNIANQALKAAPILKLPATPTAVPE